MVHPRLGSNSAINPCAIYVLRKKNVADSGELDQYYCVVDWQCYDLWIRLKTSSSSAFRVVNTMLLVKSVLFGDLFTLSADSTTFINAAHNRLRASV